MADGRYLKLLTFLKTPFCATIKAVATKFGWLTREFDYFQK